MRNHYLVGLGGALLATTALTTGASAATIKTGSAAPTTLTTFTAPNISIQNGYLTGQAIGPQYLTLSLANSYVGFKPNFILNITGGSFASTSLVNQTSAGVTLLSANGTAGGTILTTLTGAASGCSVGVLSTQIQINSCKTGPNLSATTGSGADVSFAVTAVNLSGLNYTAGAAISTAGAVISLSGSVVDSTNTNNVFESLATTAVVNAANAATVTVATAAVTVNQGSGATPFVTVSQTLGPAANATTQLTVELAAIYITGAGAVNNDLTTASPTVGGLALTVTSAALADPAISNVRFYGGGTGVNVSLQTATTLTSTATFSNTSLTGAALYAAGGGNGTNYVQVEYNGTTSITGGAAGTVAGTFSAAGGAATVALSALSGATVAVGRGGFSTQVNSVQASTNTSVTSYIRINNSAAAAGTVTVTVYNSATGAQLGTTFTTASIPGFGTLQLSAQQIEAAAAFTPTAGMSYTVSMSGTLNGYVQHVTGNPGGLFTDFSGRRAVTAPVNAD